MTGLPSALVRKLKECLLLCGPFGSDRALSSVFVDERIAPWRDDVSEAGSRRERVDLFVNDFLNRKNRAGQSVLVLFLQALFDAADEQDQCRGQLDDLAVEIALSLGRSAPPLARHNLLRAASTCANAPLPAYLGGYAPAQLETGDSPILEPLPPGLPASTIAEHLESLKNKDRADWLPASFLEQGAQAAQAVGRVEYQGRRLATAFLVAPDLVLTNAHVAAAMPVLEQGGVRFHAGLEGQGEWRCFAAQAAASPIPELDFALLRLAAPVAARPLTLSTQTPYPEQPANILQYPGIAGGSMQVALRYNAIVLVGPTRIYYVTDTEHGSSGSPVFDDCWRVIGLHRAGMTDDEARPVKNANQGVPLTAIEPQIRGFLAGG